MPRSDGHQLLAKRPMEVIVTDFLDIQVNKRGGYKHVLIVIDQLTRICICLPTKNLTKNATAVTATRILCER